MHDDAEHVRYDGPAPGTHDAPHDGAHAPSHDDDGRWKEEKDEGLNYADTLGKSKVTADMIFPPLPMIPTTPPPTYSFLPK